MRKMIPKFEKCFRKIVELVETNPLIYETLHFHQYSRLTNRFNIFQFSVIKSTECILKKKIIIEPRALKFGSYRDVKCEKRFLFLGIFFFFFFFDA